MSVTLLRMRTRHLCFLGAASDITDTQNLTLTGHTDYESEMCKTLAKSRDAARAPVRLLETQPLVYNIKYIATKKAKARR